MLACPRVVTPGGGGFGVGDVASLITGDNDGCAMGDCNSRGGSY